MRVRSLVPAIFVCAAAALAAQVAVPEGSPAEHDIRPGPGVTATRLLSEWAPALARTPGDTKVYVLDGGEPGATVFVAGGTHGNEIAGIMAAIVLVERARVRQGRLIVVPHANNSAITDVDPERPGPEFITLITSAGERRFRYGSRRTKAAHQGEADPANLPPPEVRRRTPGDGGPQPEPVAPGRRRRQPHAADGARHPASDFEGTRVPGLRFPRGGP